MQVFLQIFIESFIQAWGQLNANRLRTFLSLLGISIGIWCVVSVTSAIDSLAENIKDSFKKLGDDVVYVSIIPFGEALTQEDIDRYMKRPFSDNKEMQLIAENAENAEFAAYYAVMGTSVTKWRSHTVSNVFTLACTDHYADIFNLEFEEGRFFTPFEMQHGDPKIVLGHNVAEKLFGEGVQPIGKYIGVLGWKLEVIGVIKKEGKSLFNPVNFDDVVLMSYKTVSKSYNLKKIRAGQVCVKVAKGSSIDDLKDDITWILRNKRRLKPREENNFSLNNLSLIEKALDTLFSILRNAGFIIGIFSLLVGAFGVANIMFVSVKERTSIIGIKKALGAQRFVILTEFLIEAVVLCLMGGAVGLGLVYLSTFLASYLFGYDISLSFRNVFTGISVSLIIGIVAGIIPAWRAAQMDPVEAIRQ
jgi:putative ABC transport system permease protein